MVALLAATIATGGEPGPDAPAVDTTTVVSGVVTRDGGPVAGADVLLVAWPNDKALAALEDGELVDANIVARTRADSRGRFAVSLDPGSVGPRHTQADGGVDIELAVADDQHEVIWHFTAGRSTPEWQVQTGSVWTNQFIDPALVQSRMGERKAPTHLIIDLDAATVVQEGDDPAEWVGADGRELGIAAGAEASRVPVLDRRLAFDDDTVKPHNGPICSGYAGTTSYVHDRRERFGLSVGTIQVKPNVIQETGASHQMGVAFRAGTTGSWSQSGTMTRSTSSRSEWPNVGFNHFVHNEVNYRLYRNVCQGTSDRYQWRPWDIGALNTSQVSTTRPNSWTSSGCHRYRAGSGPHEKKVGSNATYSQGVSLGFYSVSSKASFTSSMKIRWTVSQNSAHNGGRLCSSNSFGWSSSSAPQAGGFIP